MRKSGGRCLCFVSLSQTLLKNGNSDGLTRGAATKQGTREVEEVVTVNISQTQRSSEDD